MIDKIKKLKIEAGQRPSAIVGSALRDLAALKAVIDSRDGVNRLSIGKQLDAIVSKLSLAMTMLDRADYLELLADNRHPKELNDGYKMMIGSPEMRRDIAILIIEDTNGEFSQRHGGRVPDQITQKYNVFFSRVAYSQTFGNKKFTELFVFENYMQHDEAYIQFKTDPVFRAAFLDLFATQGVNKCRYNREEFDSAAEPLIRRLMARFKIDARLFVRAYTASKKFR